MVQNTHSLVLASRSPRRKQILEQAGFSFRIEVRDTDEHFPADLEVDRVPVHIAEAKAKAIGSAVDDGEWVIAADTVVTVRVEGVDRILGKPADAAEAFQMLSMLAGKSHQVITGVVLAPAHSLLGEGSLSDRDEVITISESTTVHFDQMTDEDIHWYIEHYRPYDKAGAYAIQEGIGMRAISRIEGCYYNVVGLPMPRLYRELRRIKA